MYIRTLTFQDLGSDSAFLWGARQTGQENFLLNLSGRKTIQYSMEPQHQKEGDLLGRPLFKYH